MLVALGVAALLRLPWRVARRALIAGLIAVSALNLVMKADVIRGLSDSAQANVPGFGKVPVLAGQGYIQGYVLGSLEAKSVSATEPLPPSTRQWLPAYVRIVHTLAPGRVPVADLATDEPLLNANDLILAARLHERRDLTVNLLPGPPGPATPARYQALLMGPRPDVVITVSGVGVSYFALTGLRDADQAALEQAATGLGYRCVGAVALPDGRRAILSSSSAVPMPAGCTPRVTRVLPAAGASAVPSTAPLAAVFDFPMAFASLRRAFTLREAGRGQPVSGRLTPFGEAALVFKPDRPLRPHTTYTAAVGPAATAATGGRLGHTFAWSFTTGPGS
jgi:hypothetical protein